MALILQQVLDIEQSMLLEAYTQFVSKVEQKPKESVEDAKKWMMGQLLQQGFQASYSFRSQIGSLRSIVSCHLLSLTEMTLSGQ